MKTLDAVGNELVTQLAHQLDDDVLVEAEVETLHLARIPASHGTAHGWAHGLLTAVLVPLSAQIAVREVRLAEELRTSFSRPRRAAASRPAAAPAAPRRG